MTRLDSEIQRDVLRELSQSRQVAQTEVGVSVAHGMVTLTGTVDSYAKKLAAVHAAHHVAGVHDVANDIAVHVRGCAGQTDTAIAEAVRRALEYGAQLPAQQIDSTVAGGWVTLEGTIEQEQQRTRAARAAAAVPGVI